MDQSTALADLHRHQHEALALLSEWLDAIDAGPAVLAARNEDLRERLGRVLGAYQQFKHAGIFDPAVGSADAERMRLGRSMKIECIAAGEVFRSHQKRWTPDAIAQDWPSYRIDARLSVNALRRHIAAEREGIETLIVRYYPERVG